MARKSPQEKKQLSYERDRRNVYFENDKSSSRKAIPLRKRLVNKANRHADQQLLAAAKGVPNEAADEATDDRIHGRRRKSWRKQRDAPLGEVLEQRRGRRENS